MLVDQLNHYTLTCRAADLEALKSFYVSVLGLEPGARPAFPFDGHWLYAGGQPIVHLAALSESAVAPDTGPLHHIAFSGRDLAQARRRIAEHGIAFEEVPVPGFPLHQIFMQDPCGLKIELTFRVEGAAA